MRVKEQPLTVGVATKGTGAAGTGEGPGKRPRVRLRIAIGGALLAVIAGLAVTCGIVGTSVQRADDRGSDQAAAVAAAREEVLNIMTITPSSLKTSLNRIIDGATGKFKAEISSQKGPFTDVIDQQKVSSTGRISATGTVSMSGSSANVLVAAVATVTNSGSPKGGQRDYRMDVTLQKVNGRWLAAQVDFVP